MTYLAVKSFRVVIALIVLLVVASIFAIYVVLRTAYSHQYSWEEEDAAQVVAFAQKIDVGLTPTKVFASGDAEFQGIYEILCYALKRSPGKVDHPSSMFDLIVHSTRDYDNDGIGDSLQIVVSVDRVCFYGGANWDGPICYPLYPIEAFQLKRLAMGGRY